MSLLYVIDAYNVINHPAFASHARIKDTKAALVDFIRSKKPCGNPRINSALLIFDGYGDMPLRVGQGTEIVFSKDKTADEYIMKILTKAASARDIVVVSDDKEIQFAARCARARVLGVEEFMSADKPKVKREAAESTKAELNYTQMHRINEELKGIWLK